MPSRSLYPLARRTEVVVEELQDEILVYDLDRDQASCLNATAALVWKYADGKTSVSEMARRMASELKTPVDVRVIWYALDQLGKKNLLQEQVALPPEYSRMTRRDFLVKAGLVGAAVAIPVVLAMSAPHPAMAASCLATGQPCSVGSQCCSGTCTNNLCQ